MSELAAADPAPPVGRTRWLLRALLTRVDLKSRLSLFIGLLLGIVLLLAVYAVLGNSRRAVQGEIDAVMRLASHLLDGRELGAGADDARLLPALVAVFEHTRHLCVERPGSARPAPARGCPAAIDDRVPDWFSAHVTTEPRSLRVWLPAADGGRSPVLIHSDPADEILEAWNEARPLLLLIVAIGFLTNAVVMVSVWRALKPIDLIRDALNRIGRGELHPALPSSTTPELRTIIDGIAELGANLEAARSDNQRLLRHSLEVQERERRTIARELHDEIGQSLAAMDAEAALLHQRAAAAAPELARRTQGIRASIAGLYDGLHLLLARLRPAGLDEFGLGPTLQNLVADWSARCPQIRFEVRIEIERVPGESLRQVYLYRIAQEALTNAARHAGARRISVMLCEDVHGAIHLRIADDGRGLPDESRDGPASPAGAAGHPPGARRRGLGLLGMIERAETLGASLDIGPASGGGTCVALCLPAPGQP